MYGHLDLTTPTHPLFHADSTGDSGGPASANDASTPSEIVSAEGLELFEDQRAVSGRSDDVVFTFEDGQLDISPQRRERV